MYVLSIDLGGTFIKWAIIHLNGNKYKIIKKDKFPTNAATNSGIKIIHNIGELIRNISKYNNFSAIGLSLPGTIDTERGIILCPNHTFSKYKGLKIINILSKYTNHRIICLNDAMAAALGELNYGCLKGKNVKYATFIAIGTGIGSAIIHNNQIVRGNNYAAGEAGFMRIHNNKWELQYSVPPLIDKAKHVDKNIITGEDVLKHRDKKIIKLVDKWYDGLALGLSMYIYILNPTYLILGGNITKNQNFNCKILKQKLLKIGSVKPEISFKNVKLLKSNLGNNAPLLGVAHLLITRHRS